MPPNMGAMVSGQAMKSNDLPSLIAVLRSLPDLAIPGLGNAGVKSLVAVGTVDPLHPLSAPFAKASSGAQLIEVEGADHITIATNAQVVAAMRELLRN
jgi:pimeloyl-ACP methyl ester carboxylesterase